MKGFEFIEPDVQALIVEVSEGPVVAAHYFSADMKFYSSGIYSGEGCEGKKYPNHATLIVGYDLKASPPYFVIKNSWDETWGEEGFYRMETGDLPQKSGLCQISGHQFKVVPIFTI